MVPTETDRPIAPGPPSGWNREMPFPFLPVGALLAAAVLVAALAVFGLILRAMDRAVAGLREDVLSSLVSGLRTWGSPASEGLADRAARGPAGPEIVDLAGSLVDRTVAARH